MRESEQQSKATKNTHRSAVETTAIFHNKKKERSARRKQLRRAVEELAKERREREAVDKGDRKGQQWKRRKKGTLRIGYINADGTRDKAELVEMCRRAEADVYFILDTKYQRKDNHFAALESDMRKIAGKRGKTYSRAMPHSITKNGAMRIGGITTIVAERIRNQVPSPDNHECRFPDL